MIPDMTIRRRGGGIDDWLVALVTIISLVIAACGGKGTAAGAHSPSATATATPAFSPLPAFHDWRAAYLTLDNTVHVVSFDGKQDLTGPNFLALHSKRAYALSPDGRLLAYIDAPKWGNIVIADLTAGTLTTVTIQASDLAWSPDGTRLVADGDVAGVYGLYLVNARDGKLALIPGSGPDGQLYTTSSGVMGWTDATHVLVYSVHLPTAATGLNGPQATMAGRSVALHAPLSSGPAQTALLDITSGTAIALPVPTGMGVIQISPGGKQGLLASGCGAPCTLQPNLAVLDFATGQIHHLPRITAATGGAGGAWRPGTDVQAGLVGAAGTASPWQSNQSALALLDLNSDSVTPILTGFYPAGWSPDGQTLIVGAPVTAWGNSPLFAMASFARDVAPVPLTMSTVSFLGFVRTA